MSATVADRLRNIQLSTVRIEGCLRMLAVSETGRTATRKDIVTAALGDVDDITLEICWLHNAPREALQADALDDETRDELAGGAR